MASKAQQRAWLALYEDEDAYVPTGHQLKSWLFGGQSIPVRHALFDTEGMKGIVAALFGEARYFSDADAFWTAQNAAIAAHRAACIAAGWARESAGLGKGVAVRVDTGGGRFITQKNNQQRGQL